MASSEFYAKNIAPQLKISFSNADARIDELNGMVKTAKINIYTDNWFYSGTAASDSAKITSYKRINEANNRYKKSGYSGIPYHYIVTNETSKSLDNACIYSVYNTLYATPLSDEDISIALLCRPGTSLDREDRAGVDTLIDNLISLLKYLVSTKRISFSNIVLSTTAQNTSGRKSVNGADEFMKEFLSNVTNDADKDYNTIVDRDDIDFIVVAGPSNSAKRTLGVLSEIICGEVSNEFIDFMKELNPDCISSKATKDTALPIGSFLYIPNDTSFMESVEAEQEESVIDNTAEINRQNLLYMNEYLDRYKNYVSYINPDQMYYASETTKQKVSTSRGGKTEQAWQYQGYEFPGYHNAFLQFDRINSNEEPVYLHFLISPSDFSESRSNIMNDSKTMGGWIAQRCGRSAINIQFSGYMLDIKSQMERHEFLENYKNYIEDSKVEDQTYVNYYRQKFVIEGRDYYGHVTSLQFSKSAQMPFLYRYNITFTAYSDKKIYDAEWALLDRSLVDQGVVSNKYLSGIINEITDAINKSQYVTEETLSKYVDKDTAAYEYLLSQIRNAAGDEQIIAKITNSLSSYISDHWAKKYLDTLIDSNVVTNIEDWGYYDNPALMSHCIALSYKALVGGKVDTSGYKYWSEAYMKKLYDGGYVTVNTYQEWLGQIATADPETLAMLPRWIIEIAFYVVSKSPNKPSYRATCKDALNRFNTGAAVMNGGYYEGNAKYNTIYEAYLDALCILKFINTPQEWSDFSSSAKVVNGNALALIAKIGGYNVKD